MKNFLFVVGVSLLGYVGFVLLDAQHFQEVESLRLESHITPVSLSLADSGGLIGRMEIPRLGISTIVMDGTSNATLRHALGHITGTALPGSPGNIGISGHRDTFFRPLRHVETNDIIVFTTTTATYRYRVLNTEIVSPDDVAVLNPTTAETLTLVTCYPFYYLGPAPQRFIVHGERVL
jgi:sortase A